MLKMCYNTHDMPRYARYYRASKTICRYREHIEALDINMISYRYRNIEISHSPNPIPSPWLHNLFFLQAGTAPGWWRRRRRRGGCGEGGGEGGAAGLRDPSGNAGLDVVPAICFVRHAPRRHAAAGGGKDPPPPAPPPPPQPDPPPGPAPAAAHSAPFFPRVSAGRGRRAGPPGRRSGTPGHLIAPPSSRCVRERGEG